MFECLANLLGEEDSLIAHLEAIGAVRFDGYKSIWERAFAGVFQPSLLARLWDKVIGGSIKILVYVLACILFRFVFSIECFYQSINPCLFADVCLV